MSGCNFTQPVGVSGESVASVQPTPTPKTEVVVAQSDAVDTTQPNAVNIGEPFECVRAVPKAITRKTIYPKTTSRLEKNEEFPFQNLGYETVEFRNGDKLLIEHLGCKNYTLVFRFETARFPGKISDAKYWYQTGLQLIEQTSKGIADESRLVANGTRALRSYIRKNKKLELDEVIEFGGKEIRSAVTVGKPIKRSGNNVEMEISFGIRPL